MHLPRWLGRRPSRMERTFEAIYESNAWGSEESPSGPGSTKGRGADFIDDLLSVLDGLGCRALLDVPCGDFNWIRPVADKMDRYVGADIVPALVMRNQELFGSSHIRFTKLDLAADVLPAADVILSRDCLVHLSTRDIARCLENIRRSGATYLVTTTFVGPRGNEDIVTGSWRPLNLERPPFCPPPCTRSTNGAITHESPSGALARRSRNAPCARRHWLRSSKTTCHDSCGSRNLRRL